MINNKLKITKINPLNHMDPIKPMHHIPSLPYILEERKELGRLG